jgi:hypothetical protein
LWVTTKIQVRKITMVKALIVLVKVKEISSLQIPFVTILYYCIKSHLK